MEILPVNDLDIALHEFVNKDDKMAFYSCLRYNLEETRNKLNKEAECLKIEEEELILKVGECMQERVKERTLRPKETCRITSNSQLPQGFRGKTTQGPSSTNSLSDDEDMRQMLSIPKPTGRGRKASASKASQDAPDLGRSGASKRGRGRGSSSLKQMTLDASLRILHSERSASVSASAAVRSITEEEVESPSSEETEKIELNEVVESSEPEETFQGKGRKRAAPTGRGRGTSIAKRGKKSDLSSNNMSSIHSMFMKKDDDDDDENDNANRLKKVQRRVTRNYGAIRKR